MVAAVFVILCLECFCDDVVTIFAARSNLPVLCLPNSALSAFQKGSCDDSGEGERSITPEGAGTDGKTTGRRPPQGDTEGNLTIIELTMCVCVWQPTPTTADVTKIAGYVRILMNW